VVTKTDNAEPVATAGLAAALRRLNPVAAELRPAEEEVGAAHLLALASASLFKATAEPRAMPAGHGRVEAVAIVADEPLDWNAFALWLTMLVHRHGERILRVKGVLALAGEERPVVVHGVRHLIHPPEHLAAWPDADRRSRLVIIADGLDGSAIRRSFRAFHRLATPVPA
jgi:G3E family GTPase